MSNFEEAHVLAVDDSSVDRMLLEHLLRNSSCKVASVDSGLGALQLLGVEGLKVDMIITDYCMSDMSGYELLKKIKESSDFKEIPIVIMSSENVLTCKEKCLEEDAKDFLLKPVKFSDLKRLKDYMKKDGGINQRKLLESYDQSSSPPSILPQTSSLSSPSPPLSLTSSFSAPSSPTSLDSQIAQLKRTYSDRLDPQTQPIHGTHFVQSETVTACFNGFC